MSEFKIFSGKNVDEAIARAQEFYGQDREKLEIEIVSGGSTGIFGLVGKKKAEIRARVRGAGGQAEPEVSAEAAAEDQPATGEQAVAAPEQTASSGEQKSQERGRRPQRSGRGDRGGRGEKPQREQKAAEADKSAKPEPKAPVPAEAASEADYEAEAEREFDAARSGFVQTADSAPAAAAEEEIVGELSEELAGIVKNLLETLLGYITETAPRVEITGNSARVNALVYDEANSGLIIGREGQTLAALQYLLNRMVARKWAEPVRVQINTGEYREKQDENLRKMALYLADKAKTQGRPQSTKPLSSYHRRVVHMALQDDKSVQTRSKGEGPFKKVVILPKRRNGEAAQNAS